ncbi:MAG: FKBP-type peptidyl-prolyl cis-trans isomerase [Psychromonas sp.]|nr:FKBP-type peptidyl-prolyl cis-trans isomerase [Psychromonas sp.]
MKKILKASLLVTAIFLLAGCNSKAGKASDSAADPSHTKLTKIEKAKFATPQDKAAYAIGASFSRYVDSTLEKQAQLGLKLNKEVILQGISDTLRGKSKMTDAEMMTTLKTYDTTVQAAAKKQLAARAAKSTKESKDLLNSNKKKSGVIVTKSGLQYNIVKKGNGPKPTAQDTVTVNYVGTLADGTVFDSSVKRGEPATFPLNRVIPGWTEGIQLMHVGDKFDFVIPANLAYGDQSVGTIPPGSALRFDVELLSIKKNGAANKSPTDKSPTAQNPANKRAHQ